jgi:hypothetical protein
MSFHVTIQISLGVLTSEWGLACTYRTAQSGPTAIHRSTTYINKISSAAYLTEYELARSGSSAWTETGGVISFIIELDPTSGLFGAKELSS